MNNLAKLVIGVVVAIAALIYGFSSVYTTTNGQTAMVSNLGNLQAPVTDPGMHYKNPFTESVTLYNTQMHTVNYGGNSANHSGDDSGIATEGDLAVMDTKNVGYNIELTIQYTPNIGEFKDTLTRYGANYYDKLINPVIYDVARDVGSHYNVDTIADHRADITNELNVRLQAAFKNFPVTLNGVQLRGITLPSSITDRILATQQSQQDLNKLVNEEKKAEEQRTIDVVKADALRQQNVLDAQGKAQAVFLQKEAEAKGNHVLSASITPTLVEYIRATRWDGALPQFQVSAGDSKSGGLGFLVNTPALTPRTKTQAPAAATTSDNGGN